MEDQREGQAMMYQTRAGQPRTEKRGLYNAATGDPGVSPTITSSGNARQTYVNHLGFY